MLQLETICLRRLDHSMNSSHVSKSSVQSSMIVTYLSALWKKDSMYASPLNLLQTNKEWYHLISASIRNIQNPAVCVVELLFCELKRAVNFCTYLLQATFSVCKALRINSLTSYCASPLTRTANISLKLLPVRRDGPGLRKNCRRSLLWVIADMAASV